MSVGGPPANGETGQRHVRERIGGSGPPKGFARLVSFLMMGRNASASISDPAKRSMDSEPEVWREIRK